ncbi:calcium/sodium antiporter [Synechococcus sp. BSF8S]|uniref:calcium/sodium antiporter n=2 Tax=Cyanophyceae TaxID=3028117 RepID=UPI00162AE54D|nr:MULTISPECIES: calcium/sodium antiporter [unclassified Synechococcus]MBC1260917.1 calcium/sodium antiporter [Synechococcus sp. BSF8S]MBC1263593.1 calcium/sodium antiporter [Synechococcus sp. BSA11S]
MLSVIEVVVGILMLFGGGELFVQGSVALALLLGVPQLVIGLTVVALGTSAPELFVSLISSFQGIDDLALGNVVGSNIFNVLVVLGISAVILPMRVHSRLIRRDVPLLLAVSMAVWGMASAGRVTWQAGLALLFALVINTIWETRTAREEQAEDHNGVDPADAHGGYGPALIRLAAGLGLLVWGSQILVKGASAIALGLGVSQTLIGLTIVAAGTSMPELVTSIMAAIRGKTDLAIGNVVGSNLLNQLLILGSCAFVSGGRGLSVDPALIRSDLPIMVATTVALLPIFWTGGEISRREGVLLVGLYGLYMVEQILPLTAPDLASPLRSFSLFVVIPVLVALLAIRVWHHWHQDQREAWQDN